MTDTTKKDPHAELMRLADEHTTVKFVEGIDGNEFLVEQASDALENYARTLTDRLTQAEQEATALNLTMDWQTARIAELEQINDSEVQKYQALELRHKQMAEMCLSYQNELKPLKDQLEAVGSGGVGVMIPNDKRWPKLEKPAALNTGGMATFGKGVSARLLVEAAYRHYERTEAERKKTPEQRKDDEVNRRILWDLIHGAPTQPAPAVSNQMDTEVGNEVDCPQCGGWCPKHCCTVYMSGFGGIGIGNPDHPSAASRAPVVQLAPAVVEPVKLLNFAVWDDGELRLLSGRKGPEFDCELYAMPSGKRAPNLYTAPHPQQIAEPVDRSTWCKYVAGMVGAYLGEPVESECITAIARIIERRLQSLPTIQSKQIAEPASNAAPTSKGIYAWVPDSGAPALVLVNTRPSQHSPGGILNAHVVKEHSFYDGCSVSEWGAGRWVLLRQIESASTPKDQS